MLYSTSSNNCTHVYNRNQGRSRRRRPPAHSIRNAGKLTPYVILNTDLVTASLGNVSDPSIGVVARLVINSKESNVHSTGSEHGNLELGTNRWAAPRLGAHSGHQLHVRLNMALGLSWESLDTPYNRLLLWFVLGTSKGMLDLGLGCILRYRNFDYHVSRKELIRKVCNNLEIDRNPGGRERKTVSNVCILVK